jgi:hypothetical protein
MAFPLETSGCADSAGFGGSAATVAGAGAGVAAADTFGAGAGVASAVFL